MKKIVITEEQVKTALENLLNEETSKISRQQFNRVQFKIEELQNSLNETIKEFKKLEDSLPNSLRSSTNKKVTTISSHLLNARKEISDLFVKVTQIKKNALNRQTPEEKGK
jgi:uncharacterized protein (UPF0216 family)